MNDKNKTKQQLYLELTELRSQISMLQDSQRTEKELTQPANSDPLTGLPSRTVFFSHLNQALSHARQTDEHVAVLFFSLDRFKLINDSLGHPVGDILLRKVADRLSGCLRQSDLLCRPGRDEFMLLLPKVNSQEKVTQVADRIFNSLETPFLLKKHELVVSASLGISMFPDGGAYAEPLIRNAYSAMNQAKNAGKNKYRFFSPHLNDAEFSRMLMENDLRLAVNRCDFTLRYQPQMELRNGKMIGMEALLRWEHPEMGFVSPAEFIPLVEKIGLMETMGEWVLRTACEQHISCQKTGGKQLSFAVNLSPSQLHRKSAVQSIEKVLTETGLAPHNLEVEITEGALLNNHHTTVSTLSSLHDMGVKIAIDDFGTGYSSLAYLSQFPISKLKIDKSFVAAITTDRKSAAISRAIIALAHSLDLQVIAEGVETTEQLELLRSLDCDEVQGYLLGHPLTADETATFLAAPQQPYQAEALCA